ncbi:MAG: hypothetical protein R2801_03890 [Chitinophagales bacterium]
MKKLPNWKQRLIKEEKLLEGATFILIPNDNSYCILAWQQRPSKENKIKNKIIHKIMSKRGYTYQDTCSFSKKLKVKPTRLMKSYRAI